MQATSFPRLVITSVQYPERRSAFIVPNRIFGYGDERVQTVEEALEVVFRQLNRVDGSELISQDAFGSDHPGLRSMSVGDIVTFRGPGGSRQDWQCDGMGWSDVSEGV